MKKIISPHVNIYKFPVTAISSIGNRLTGLALTGYFVAGGLYTLCPYKEKIKEHYENLNWKTQKLIHYGFIFPSIYHTFGGLRHFYWDKNPNVLTNIKVQRSSFALLGISIIATLVSENHFFKKNIKNSPEKGINV